MTVWSFGRKMPRKFAIQLTLFCYVAIALGGQGLHVFLHDHEHDEAEHPATAVSAGLSSQPTFCPSHDDDHDCDHCAVCQHHSLGQLFIAAPPAEILLSMRELLSAHAPQCIPQPALFSPAQPRAPPIG
jgi:hypothetical protein